MKILSKRNSQELHPIIQKVLVRLNQKVMSFANFLQQKTNSYSTRKRKFFLMVVSLAFIIQSTIVIINSFGNADSVSISVVPIRVMPPQQKIMRPVLKAVDYGRIKSLRQFMDTHKAFHDSLIAIRPHLIDSLNYLQELYKKYDDEK